ncbi:MAG TPA: methionyl-tRNA formyltransferase, partial [Novosphingobium sp.]|nr:methionyl-tRNA formyltransferase [Novosphingobium sp.]
YGLILPRAVLDAPRHGCLNIHASLLPRWRGAAPIHRAILAGDAQTGVGIMRMETGLDTGPVLAEARTDVSEKTTGELTGELAAMGAELVVRVLADLPAFAEVPQAAEGLTYAHKIDKAEARLDFTASAGQVLRQIRAFVPAPGAFFELEGERYKVLAAEAVEGSGTPGTTLDDALTIACGAGAICPTLVQRAGKPAMPTAALLNGRAIPAGTQLN